MKQTKKAGIHEPVSRSNIVINPGKENGWLETSAENLAWKIGLKILEYCTDKEIHEKSNCMQFLLQTNLVFA